MLRTFSIIMLRTFRDCFLFISADVYHPPLTPPPPPSCPCLGGHENHNFGVVFGSSWGSFRFILGLFSGHPGIVFGSSWDRFRVILGLFSGHLGTIFGSFWGRFRVILGSFSGHLGIIFGSSWGRFRVILGSFSDHHDAYHHPSTLSPPPPLLINIIEINKKTVPKSHIKFTFNSILMHIDMI